MGRWWCGLLVVHLVTVARSHFPNLLPHHPCQDGPGKLAEGHVLGTPSLCLGGKPGIFSALPISQALSGFLVTLLTPY